MYSIRKIGISLAATALLCACNEMKETTSFRMHRDCYMDSEHLHVLKMDLQLDIPTSIQEHGLLRSVQDEILEHYLGKAYVGKLPLKALDDYCLDHRTRYLQNSRNYISQSDYASLPLDSTEQWAVTTCFSKRNLLVVQRNQDYLALDLKTGRQVKLDDLLADRAAVEIQLQRALPENFYIKDGRIGFIFESGTGERETGSLELKQLRSYMRKEWKWLCY